MFLLPLCLACLTDDSPPPTPREFRGVWVATVDNIDWPTKRGLPAAQQQAELVAVFDKAKELGLNAVIFQIRPMCDALYASKLEPWSEYLTGTAGRDPGYDPLAQAVKLAHERGLELHAWFNPYRAWHPSAKSPVPADHLVKTRPDLAKHYGKHHWLNPTNPETAAHTLKVIADVVRRYDLDGIHLDDYFYPYPEKDAAGAAMPFPDADTRAAYEKSGGTLSVGDWRRAAVDDFVQKLYVATKAEKRWVKVGISPFGIWRPGHPPGIAGFDQYAELYADARKWLREGWVDYFTPQLYWPIKQEKQSYPKLLAWWAGENPQQRHLWPGNIPSRVTGAEKGWPAAEIVDQVKVTRAQAGAGGNIHFSLKPLRNNAGGVGDALKAVYREPAVVPASPWLGERAPRIPEVERTGDTLKLCCNRARWFVVKAKVGTGWTVSVHPAIDHVAEVKLLAGTGRVVVTAVDRVGVESAPNSP